MAFLQYTGGTTGLSKGATLLHGNVVANVLQCEVWFQPMLDKIGPERQLTNVCALPLYHIFALTACFMLGARLGMLNLLIPNPRDLPALVRALQGHQINLFPAVNTLFNALADDPAFGRLDFSQLLISNGGGMAVQRATAQKWLKLTGCPDRGGLWPVGDFTCGHGEPCRCQGVQRQHRLAAAVDRHCHSRRRRA